METEPEVSKNGSASSPTLGLIRRSFGLSTSSQERLRRRQREVLAGLPPGRKAPRFFIIICKPPTISPRQQQSNAGSENSASERKTRWLRRCRGRFGHGALQDQRIFF